MYMLYLPSCLINAGWDRDGVRWAALFMSKEELSNFGCKYSTRAHASITSSQISFDGQTANILPVEKFTRLYIKAIEHCYYYTP